MIKLTATLKNALQAASNLIISEGGNILVLMRIVTATVYSSSIAIRT